jgi:hypothetical protein
MSVGRFTMRGRVFQGRAFAPLALSGGAGVVPATDRYTRPLILLGTSKEIQLMAGTSKQTFVLSGTSQEIQTMGGTTP